MAVTLFDLRANAPTTTHAQAFDTLMRTEPVLSKLLFDAVSVDEVAYRRRRGAATVAHFNPDSTLSDGTDETFDRLVARIRPIGGQIQVPVIGGASASTVDHINAKVRAAAWQFMSSFINGGFGTVTLSPVVTANDGATAGPYWDLSTRGSGGVLRLVIGGAVTTSVMDFKADGDTGYGLVNGAAAADLQGLGDGIYRFASANPNLWVKIDLDVSDLLTQFAADGTYYISVVFSSSSNAFDGLLKLVEDTTSMLDTASAAAEAFDLSQLDLMALACKTNGSKGYILNETTWGSFLAEMRGLGGVTWMEVAGRQVPAYNGIPVFTSSYMLHTRTYAGTANCAAMALIDFDEGVRGIFRSGAGSYDYDGKSYGGLRVANLGEVINNAENLLYRITWHVGVEHLDLPGVVFMDGITN